MQSLIALASVSGSALGTPPVSLPVVPKIGRTSNVHPGQIADGRNWREAHNMPATAVPWRQAALLTNEHLSFGADASSRSFAPAKPGWSLATGAIDQPDDDLRAAAGHRHQRGQHHLLQWIHRVHRCGSNNGHSRFLENLRNYL